ncbi:MAG: hypothetical protein ABH865_03795 [Candidatus Omnitrophota bacterium]|nr:hypothetical protein [Candidatus Omnitrophota bacterium]
MKPRLAAFLSFLLNGIGQIYNGQVKKGSIFILISFVCTMGLVLGILLIYKGFLVCAHRAAAIFTM